MPTYAPSELIFTSGQGAYLYDNNGKSYIDFSSGIAVTSLAVGMNNAVVRNLGANKASIGNYLRSLFTALLAILLIGEVFEIYHGIAFILVISGIWLLSMGRSINEN